MTLRFVLLGLPFLREISVFSQLKILNPNFEVLEKNMAGVEVKPLKKVNKPYKIRREGSFVSGFK